MDSLALRGDLRTAEIIITVGRGVSVGRPLALTIALAERVGGQLAATRGAAVRGLLPLEREIGLSGVRVAPKLYIGCGVSGANFHTIGMEKAAYIVAVNWDPTARIHTLAHCSVLADVESCIGALLEYLDGQALREPGVGAADLLKTYFQRRAWGERDVGR